LFPEGQEFLLAKLISNLSPETLQNVISDLKDREAEALENSNNFFFHISMLSHK
jgi:hypothetical protein